MMSRFENENFYYNPSDSESGMQPRYREPSASVATLCSPQNQHCMQLPLAGLIHMCDSKTRRLILRKKVMYISTRKRRPVNAARVRPGTKLFIFDFEDRMLWGTYEITTFPHFMRTRGADDQENDFPYHIYFQLYQMHEPLEEEAFKHAIKENYYTPYKFHFGLSRDQVANLLALFHFHASYSRKTQQIIQPSIPEKRRFQAAHKFSAFGYKAVNSRAQGHTHKKCARKDKHSVQLDNPQIIAKAQLMADSKRTNSTSPVLQKKSYSLKDEILQCNLKIGRAELFQMDNSTACIQESLEQDDGDSSTDTLVSLEDGEFVLPQEKENCFISRPYQKLQLNNTASVEEVDGDCDSEFQTRNFIEILEHSLTSNSNTNTIHSSFLTVPDGEIIEAINFDEAVNNPAQLQHAHVKDNEACEGAANNFDKVNNLTPLEHVGVKDNEAGKRAEFIEDKGKGLLARTLGKHMRNLSPEFSTDGGTEVKGSVWLRLVDPRPIKTDLFFADEDAFEPEKSQQCDFESIHYSIWKERQSCLQTSISFHDEGYYTSGSKMPQEGTSNMDSK